MSEHDNDQSRKEAVSPLERLRGYPKLVLTVSEIANSILFRTHRTVIKQILQGKIPAKKDSRGWWVVNKDEYLEVLAP